MTLPEYTRTPAGPALDALVHERLMPFQKPPCLCGPAPNGYDSRTGQCLRCGGFVLPHYSTELTAAWEVFVVGLVTHGSASVGADMEDWGRGAFGDGPEQVVTATVGAWSYTAPVCEAICKAALLAAEGR